MNSLAIATLTGGLVALTPTQDTERWEPLLARAKLSLLQAAEVGQRAVPNATLFHIELEPDGRRVVYSIDLAQGAQSVNVLVDATNGRVLEQQLEDEDHSREVSASKVALTAAIRGGLTTHPGSAVEAELVLRAGQPVIELKIVQGKRLARVDIDGLAAAPAGADAASSIPFTDVFHVDRSDLGPHGANPYLSLVPGHTLYFEGQDEGQDATLKITVLDETRRIDGVETRVIVEHETLNGAIKEISRNFFAISKRTNCVYYFGEEVDIYEDGEITGHPGAWLSGVDGARFGLVMPGAPLLGARYYQEVAPGVAMDRAEVVGVDDTFATPAGEFTQCVRTEETTPLESGRDHKTYAPGVGLLNDGPLKLVRFGVPGK